MEGWLDISLFVLTCVLLGAGCFFSLTAAVGMLRFPDFYSRTHASGINDTLSVLLFMSALVVECVRNDYGYLVWGRLILIVLFLFMSGPAAGHAITQAALLDGLKPWTRKDGKP